MERLLNYINGSLLPPASGVYLPNIEPATGEAYSEVPDSGSYDIEAAVHAAEAAFHGWSSLPAKSRGEYMLRIAQLIRINLDELAALESRDTGKPFTLARSVDIPRAIENFEFFATAIQHFASESHATGAGAINYTLRDSLGVVGCISPWNLPLYLFTWKIAPALAAGNCVVAKPSEITPATAARLSELCIEAGLPPGVLNIVHGKGPKAGIPLVEHPSVKAISFTGGTSTGADIAKRAAPTFKKLSLELGGKNPTIVFADCEYDSMIETVVRSSFSNQGEICLCGSRILVERSLYERFRSDFIDRVRSLVIGDPNNSDTQIGALVSEQHRDKVVSYIQLAKEEGGTVLCGGERVRVHGRCEHGFFLSPAVIEGLPNSCRTNQEEIFGPVVTIMPFDTENEAVELANGTGYGLAASVWTQSLSRAHILAKRLAFGIVWINCWMLRDLRTPFGGMKNSGTGREGGWEALRFFTEPKNVCIKYGN